MLFFVINRRNHESRHSQGGSEMFRTSEEVEAFRKSLSEKLGIAFSSRKSSSNFFVNIQAFPEGCISDNWLFHCIEECLNAMGIHLNRDSLRAEKSGIVFVKMTKGEDVFYLGVTNESMKRSPCIIVTATPL